MVHWSVSATNEIAEKSIIKRMINFLTNYLKICVLFYLNIISIMFGHYEEYIIWILFYSFIRILLAFTEASMNYSVIAI